MQRLLRALPQAIQQLDTFVDLNDSERNKFANRLIYIQEVVLRIEEFCDSDSKTSVLKEFVDDIELDLMNCISIRSDVHVSPWLVHSSWTFGTTPSQLLDSLSIQLTEALQTNPPGMRCTPSEFVGWVSKMHRTLRELLESFYAAETLASALGHLIALDICLVLLLGGVSQQRFNQGVNG